MSKTQTFHRQHSTMHAFECDGCDELIDLTMFTMEMEKFDDGTPTEFRRFHRKCWTAKTGVPC